MKPTRILKTLVLLLMAVVGVTFLADPDVITSLAANIKPMLVSMDGYTLATAPLTIAFARDIEEKLFPNNEFYMQSQDDSLWVNNKRVEYPVEGTKPTVEINRVILPAQIERREDDENSYDLDEFTSTPTLITYSEELLVNYPKRQSVLRGHQETLDEDIANYFGNIWFPNGADNIVRSTGASRVASSSGATGNRKRFKKEDVIAALEILNRMNAPLKGRNMLIPPEVLSDLLLIDDFVHADKIGGKSALVEGSIGRILGLDVFMRSYTAPYDNSGTPVKRALKESGAASDNAATLVWSSRMVTRAKGSVKTFYNPDKADYYGSLFSALVRAGGKIRKDKKGVVALVESHA